MEEVVLADKYAKALIACAQEADLIERLDKELALFERIIAQQPKLRQVLCSPVIALKQKRELLESIFRKEWASRELKSFLFLLLEKRRFNLFGEITKIYKDLIYSLRKRLKVFVESASALDARQKQALKEKLAQIYRKEIDLFVRINPAFIGGARIFVGHTLFDGTVQARLSLLREEICKR